MHQLVIQKKYKETVPKVCSGNQKISDDKNLNKYDSLTTYFIIFDQLFYLMIGGLLLFGLIFLSQSFRLSPLETGQTEMVGAVQIGPGRGYSTDRQQVSSVVCFNVKTSPYSKTESVVRLDQGANFTEIQKALRVDVSAKVGISTFSVEADVSFLKEVRDSDFSLSVSYFQYVQSELTMEMGYGPAGALTFDGMRAYGPVDNPNPRFGLICGDKYIGSFKVGANLIFSLKLQFQSHSEKQQFAVKLGVNIGSFLSISTEIERIATATNIMGRVEIMAYQSGGNPAELAKILNSTCGSSYCAATCSMTNMGDCAGAINGLLKYASSNFPNQVNISNPNTLSPFSLGFADLQDIKWIGLAVPSFYVNKDVVAMREALADQLLKSQFYMDRVSALTSKFAWDKESRLYQSMVDIVDDCKVNIEAVMDQSSGGILCFKDPEECVQNGNQIISNLKPIESEVVSLNNSIKYKLNVNICSTTFYRISDDRWYYPNSTGCSPKVQLFIVSQNNLEYVISTTAGVGPHPFRATYSTIGNLTAKDDDAAFVGMRNQKKGSESNDVQTSVPRVISELAIAAYK